MSAPPHGGKTELVRGEVVTKMPVGGPHGSTASSLVTDLEIFNRQHRLGLMGVEVGFILFRDPDVVRAPDVHFVRTNRLTGGRMPRGFFDGPPDLAVEIVSPDDTDREIQEKVTDYLAAGAPRVWVVRPELGTVTVHRGDGTARTLSRGATLSSDDAGFDVQGLAISVAALLP